MGVRVGRRADLPAVVAIHQAAFPEFFLTNLGGAFLHAYYSSVLDYKRHILLVASVNATPVGFAAGFVDPAGFYSHLRSRRISLTLAVMTRLVRKPQLLPRLLRNYRRTGVIAHSEVAQASELASLAVLPEFQGRSLGRALVDEFNLLSAAGGAQFVTLTTDAHQNDSVNQFYMRCGYSLSRTIAIRDRVLREYRYALPDRAA